MMVCRRIILGLAASLVSMAARSETVVLQSGDHKTFTRIVLPMDSPSPWRFGRVDGGYGLELARPEIRIDTSRVFGRIARDRLVGLESRSNGAGLTFQLDCDCHAWVSEYRTKFLIVDIIDGAPPAGSVFEAGLPSSWGPGRPAQTGPRIVAAELSAAATAQLGYFWNDILEVPPASAEPGATDQPIDVTRDYSDPKAATQTTSHSLATAATPLPPVDVTRNYSALMAELSSATDITRDYSAKADVALLPPFDITHAVTTPQTAVARQTSPPKDQQMAMAADQPSLPIDITKDRTNPAESAGGELAGPIKSAHPQSPPQPLPLIFPDRQMAALAFSPLPLRPANPRIDTAREALLLQLSRAANQGLISVVQPERPLLPSQLVAQENGATVDPGEKTAPLPDQGLPKDHLTIKAETSIDRDSIGTAPADQVTQDGLACLPDSSFAVRDWGDARPMHEQLSERRQALVGEFAVPPSAVVADLAKTYLYFGFGAEAADTLRAFGTPVTDYDILLTMAQSIEYGFADGLGRLEGMTACDSAVALWATLAMPRLSAGDPINVGAVVRSLSGLPIALRRQVGPVLSARFLEFGDERTARTLQDAVGRFGGDAGPQSRLIAAKLDLTLDKIEQAELTLDQLVAEDGPASPEALILLIDTKIDQNVKVDQPTMETAAALAFEHRGTELGSRLARAEVLSKAAYGNFDAAFTTLALQTKAGPKAMPTELDQDLFSLLQANADDATFLRHMLGSLGRMTENDLSRGLRQALGQRMASLGFPDEAERVLAASAKPKDADRMVLARIALAKEDPGSALRQIEGLESPATMLIKAEALRRLGYHAQAAKIYAQVDQPVSAASSGWLAGDLLAMQRHGTPAQQVAVAALLDQPSGQNGPDPAVATAPTATGALPVEAEPVGILARDKQLLQASQVMRDELAALLEAFPAPDIPAGSGQP